MGSETTPAKKDRLIFIDVMRGIAVLWMIETHVVDIVLSKSFKTGFFYNTLNISNGFVAVSFLFCAGAGFWLASMKKSEDYKKFKPPLWVYLRRLGLILLIAYWLHFPAMSLEKFFNLKPENWQSFFECDVLQTIVYSSLVALVILMITPKLKYIPYIFGALAVGIFLAAPFVWAADPFSVMPAFFASLFAKFPVSKFPLLPWSGYFFGGAAVTAAFMQTEDKKKFALIGFIGGFILMFVLFYTRDLTSFYPGYQGWWLANPFHAIFRISTSIWVFCLLYLIEKWYKEKRIGNILRICGQESLFIYTSHLLVVYGSIANFGMKYYIGNRLDWIGTALITIALCAACYAVALGWNILKAKDMKRARFVMTAVMLLFLIVFIVNPA